MIGYNLRIDGVAVGHVPWTQVEVRLAGAPPFPVQTPSGTGDLEDLARSAVVTPSTAAVEAFAVLVDALLERGIIKPPPTPAESIAMFEADCARTGGFYVTHAAPKPLLDQAWEWAFEATALPLWERMRQVLLTTPPAWLVGDGSTPSDRDRS